MNLIEVYIQEVTRRLPEKSRADIALELRSTIEDTLPEDYSEKDVKVVLEKLGSPAALANGYRDQPMHLIGPRYFDVYVSLLKMILPIAAVIAVISMVAEYFIGYSGDEAIMNVVLTIMGKGIWNVIEVGIQVFFWLTLVFAILERMDKEKDQQPLSASLKKWTPDDLKNIPYIPKKKAISKFDVFGSLMWTAIWATLYFYADHLVGVYEGGGEGLRFVIPALDQGVLMGYWPIVVAVIAFEVGFALYKLVKGQWTKQMALFNAVFELLSTIVFIVILINPALFNQDFLVYMSDLFSTTAKQIETWIFSGAIIAFVVSAAINVYDVFRKARV
jgi:hypothetical protein